MDNKLVSVIIPAYNAGKYISEAMESVLTQTYPSYEIIVVDDGSIDRTKETIDGLRVKGEVCKIDIKYIYQENKGPAAARNKGIKEAKGDYIAFLDSDDLWLPEKLERQMALLRQSNYAMVYSDMSHEVDGEEIYRSYLKEKKYKFYGNGDVYKQLLRENFIFTPTVIVKKAVIKSVGYFDERYKICEDYKMWLKIAKDYKIGFLDEPLVIRRRNKSNITQDKFLFIASGINLFRELLDNNHDQKTKKIINNELYRRIFDLGYYHWDKGNISLAREYFTKAMRYKHNVLKAIPYLIASFFPSSFVSVIRKLKNEMVL